MHESDLSYLGEIFSAVYTDSHFDKFTPEPSTEYLTWLFKRCPELAFVAEENGTVVGAYLAALKPWFDGPHVVDGEIFVAESYRKHGIGRILTKTLLTEARERYGAVVVEAITYSDDAELLAWHAKNARKVVPELVFITGKIDEVLNAIEAQAASK